MENSDLSAWISVWMPPGVSRLSSAHVSPRRALFWVVANTGMFRIWPRLELVPNLYGNGSEGERKWMEQRTSLKQLLRRRNDLRELMNRRPELVLQVTDARPL